MAIIREKAKPQAKAAPKSSPALEQMQRLTAAFDVLNEELFGGQLPPVMLTLRSKPGSYGSFSPNKWKNAEGVLLDMISLDSQTAATRPLMELLSQLAHEMAHSWVFHVCNGRRSTGGHGAEWRQKMQEIGLSPVQIGTGWRQATHSINPNGAFAAAFHKHQQRLQALPWQECVKEANKGTGTGVDRVKFQCPVCSSNAWARPAAMLLCGNCSSPEKLVEMLPEYRAEGGGGKGGTGRAKATPSEHYPEPSGVPALPVWTDELSRELRLHTGLDHPPRNTVEALAVLTHGVKEREPDLLPPLFTALENRDEVGTLAALKAVYKHRCKRLHPDMEGGSEVAFKSLQAAYLIIKRGK